MSLCPTKDIHSVYLDSELPLAYVKEYEEHVKSCPKCSAELENLKKIRGLMEMGNRPELSQLEMDEGFKRLQIRMTYSKHKKAFEAKPSPWKIASSTTFKYTVPAMAAAAVFALVLPLGLKSGKKGSADVNVPAVASAPSAPSVSSTVSNIPVNTVSMNSVNKNTINVNSSMNNSMKPHRPVVKSEEEVVTVENMPQVVDVFRPNFDNGDTISIQITFPGINATPYTTEIGIPAEMYKGSLSETD